MKLSLLVSAEEAVHTFTEERGAVCFGADNNEVSIHGTPGDLRRLADKIVAAADRAETAAFDAWLAHPSQQQPETQP